MPISSKFRFVPVGIIALAISFNVVAAGTTRSITVARINTEFVFRCEGSLASSVIRVVQSTSKTAQPVLTRKLDESDDCSQATWTADDIGSQRISTLVMVNPGRLGLNSQLSVFLISNGSVSFAGYIPANAERIDHSTEYRSYSSDSDSTWQRTDTLSNGRFVISQEMRMMRDGSVCIGPTGTVLQKASCKNKLIYATPERPLCLVYLNHVGKLTPLNSCADLKAH